MGQPARVTAGAARSRAAGPFASIQARVILVILSAILPLAAISAALAWRDYRAETDLSERRVQAGVASYLARERARLGDATSSISALSHLLRPLEPGGCEAMLETAETLSAGQYADLTVVDRGLHILCEVAGSAPHRPAVTLTRSIASAPGTSLIASVPLRTSLDGFRAAGTWLVAPDGKATPITSTDEPVPEAAILRLLAGGMTLTRQTSGQRREILVGGHLADGYTIAVADYATSDESRAATILVRRIALIAIILIVGLVLVGFGAHATVAAPMQALTRRVIEWRHAGHFDDATSRFAPAELIELIDAFGAATRALAERERELERARAAQDLAFKEIHHRVKNNLQIIASLLNLQANRIRLPEARAEFQSARDRVRALATLHRHLYADASLHTIAMRSFLLELCGQLFQAIGEREGQRIRLEVEAPELQMSTDQAVPLALIVTEAVGNAVKYAFPDGRSGSVSVALRRLGEDRVELVIQDDGVGIPAGRAETDMGVRDGLGIQLIGGFAKQLGATLEVEGGDGRESGGTRYRLELRLRAL